jgi:hypothetical protein
MKTQRGLVLLFFAAACGGGGGGDDDPMLIDAEPPPDSEPRVCYAEENLTDYAAYFFPYREDPGATTEDPPVDPADPNNPGFIQSILILNEFQEVTDPLDLMFINMQRGAGPFVDGIAPGAYNISAEGVGLGVFILGDYRIDPGGPGTPDTFEMFYVANGGTLTITEINPGLAYEFVDVTFVESDVETGEPIDDGCTTSFASGSFDFNPTQPPGCDLDPQNDVTCWLDPAETECDDGVDNDQNGDTDCDDLECVNDDDVEICPPPPPLAPSTPVNRSEADSPEVRFQIRGSLRERLQRRE